MREAEARDSGAVFVVDERAREKRDKRDASELGRRYQAFTLPSVRETVAFE